MSQRGPDELVANGSAIKQPLSRGCAAAAFTGTGRVTDDEPCQVEMTPDFHPFRRNVAFDECVEAPIRPLLDALTFIEDKKRWGYRFRFGFSRSASTTSTRSARR